MAVATALQDRKRVILPVLMFLGACFLCLFLYANTINAPFLFDDRGIITENDTTKNLPLALKTIGSKRYVGYLSFALNYHLNRFDVRAYHLTNIAIHLANGIVLYVFLRLLFFSPVLRGSSEATDFLACSSVLLFLAHPVQTQAVSYLSQRFTSLATLFYLTSLMFYVKARLIQVDNNSQAAAGIKATASFSLSLLFAMLAFKTKEIAFTLPIMIFLCEIYFFRAKVKGKEMKRAFSFLLLFAVIGGVVLLGPVLLKKPISDIASSLDISSRETVEISRGDYLTTQVKVLVTYLRLMAFPVNQSLDYAYPVQNLLFSPDMIVPLCLLFSLIVLAVGLFRSTPLISFGIAWFFVALSVESSVIPIRDVINEHRLYLPLAGICMAFVAGIERVLQKGRLRFILLGFIMLFFTIGTINRNLVWQTPGSLWSDVISKAPNNARALNNLGIVYKELKFYGTANDLFERALKADKDYSAVYYNLGDIQYQLGNNQKALEYLTVAMQGNKSDLLHVDILNKMGRTYGALGDKDESIRCFLKAIELSPYSPVFRNNLAVQYIKAGRFDEAVATLEKAIDYAPDQDYLYLNLANAYAGKGDENKRAMMAQKAQELRRARQP